MKLAMVENFSCALWVTAAFCDAACAAEMFCFLRYRCYFNPYDVLINNYINSMKTSENKKSKQITEILWIFCA